MYYAGAGRDNMRYLRLARYVWLFLCLVPMAFWIRSELAQPGTDAFVVVGWSMALLTAPLGLLVMFLWGFSSYLAYEYFALPGLPASLSTPVFWLLSLLVGYFQWFVLTPKILARLRGSKS